MATHYSLQQFDNADEHGRNATNMKQQYYQIEKGSFCSSLEQFNLDGLSVFSERVNRRIVEYGGVSPGVIGIGWASFASVPPTSRGREVTPCTIGAMRHRGEWFLHMPPDVEIHGMTLAESEFDVIAEGLGLERNSAGSQLNSATPAGETSIDAVRRLKARLGALQAQARADRLACPATRYALRKALLDDVFYALEEIAPPSRDNLTLRTYSDIVRRCQGYVLLHAGSPISVLDLCVELRVSRRTLQTSFQHVTGHSPTDYLRAVRLGEVRTMLRRVPASQMSIASIAARWGFTHLGKFANRYHRMFGELPSQTIRFGHKSAD